MINRPPPDLGDIWHDGPRAPGPAKPSPVRNDPARSRKTRVRQTRPRPRRRWLAALGYGALATACLGMAALAFVLVAAPVELVRDRLIEQVKARTGRDLAIAGPAALSFFPRPAISLRDVSLSAPEGFEAPPMLVVSTVEADLNLWSLLTAQPALDRITLRRPTIALSIDAEGRRSWDLASLRLRRPRSLPATDNAQAQPPSGGPADAPEATQTTAQSRFGSGSIRVIDGTVRYRDHGSGSNVEIKALNVNLVAGAPDTPLKVDGTLTLHGQPLTIAATASPVRALLASQPAQLAIKVSGAPFEGAFQGSVALAAGISLDGTLKLQAPSARALGDWLGRPLPAHGDPDVAAFSADLKVTPAKVALSRLQANLGAVTIAGALALENKQQRQHLSGSLDVSELDFGRLLTRPRSIARTQASPAPTSPPRSSEPPAATSAGPPADKRGRSREWSDDPIDLALLGQIDANLTLSAGRLVYKELTTGPSRLSVAVEGGLGRITLEDIELYGGRARGILTLDASGGVPVAGSQIILTRVALHPFLTAFLQFPWLDGAGNMYLEVAGQGLTERQMVESLNGKVEVSAAEGAVIGLDVGKIVRNLQRGRLPSLTPSSDEKTPFSELASTFAITNGIATNKDLKLVSPHVQLNGEGTLDLGQRQIDYTVRTKLGGAPDPDATIRVGSLEVPIAITGSWDKPDFGIKGQEQLNDTLKQVRKNLKSQDVRDALKGLLQGDGEKRVKPRDLIDKLLKKD
jgi:AsmA protein